MENDTAFSRFTETFKNAFQTVLFQADQFYNMPIVDILGLCYLMVLKMAIVLVRHQIK